MLDRLREFANPYDFANPISTEKLFIGRTTETADLIYYLNHARLTNRPIHLAFVGARASGKTSFLNMAELEGKRRDFCTVRINLNEGDVENDLEFFRKLFHSITMAAFTMDAFGGKKGKTFFKYLEMTSTGEITDIEEMPLIFAILLARALKANNKNVHIADDILADDLKTISEELGKTVVILLDECNVLSSNRIILEKLRNVFMNLSGYMLVFAATSDFFPVMDEVFSPIMRQFKRIDIGEFKSEDDVSACIRRPLSNLGLGENDISRLVPQLFIREVDLLSGRRPYEIQLICHTLFRRVQDGVATRFGLDLKTLENIQKELASGKNLDERPAIRAARNLKRKYFLLLDRVGGGKDRLSIKDNWRMEYIFFGTIRWTEAMFKDGIDELVGLGLIEEKAGRIKFNGDDFDKIFIKYIARTKQANVTFNRYALDISINYSFAEYLSDFEDIAPVIGKGAADNAEDMSGLLNLFSAEDEYQSESMQISSVAEDLINAMLHIEEGRVVRLYEIFYQSDLGSGQIWFIWPKPEHTAGLKKLSNKLAAIKARGAEVNFVIEERSWNISIPTLSVLTTRFRKLNNDQLLTRLGGTLMEIVQVAYVRQKNKDRALLLAEAAFSITGSRLHGEANNIGYLYLDRRNFGEAALWFEAAEKYNTEGFQLLLKYNLGVLDAMTENYSGAREKFNSMPQVAAETKFDEAACAYSLIVKDDKLHFEEVIAPKSLLSLAKDSLQTLDALALA